MRVGPTEGDDAAAGRAVSVKKIYKYISKPLVDQLLAATAPSVGGRGKGVVRIPLG